MEHVSVPKTPTHFAGNERFLPAFPSSVLSGYALNKQTGHVRGEGEKHARERAIYAGESVPFRSDVQLKGSLE